MSQMLSPADKSNISIIVGNIATNMTKIKLLQEDIKEAAKGIADKYKPELKPQDLINMAKLHLIKDEIEEKHENANKVYELYDQIMCGE